MKENNQLLLNLSLKKSFSRDDFFVSSSNYYAFEIVEQWPNWEKKLVNINGEIFSGKTHLLKIFKKKQKLLL